MTDFPTLCDSLSTLGTAEWGADTLLGRHVLIDWVDPYLRARRARGEIIASTAMHHRGVLQVFAGSYGRRQVARLSRCDIERWQAVIGHQSPGTRGKCFSVVRCFCRWLVLESKVRKDPTVGMVAPRRPRSVPRALPFDAVSAILAVAPDQRSRLIAVLMVQQGLRRCEVAWLQVGDLDLRERTMRIVGKGGHERVLPITAETQRELVIYLAKFPARSGPLIRSYRIPADGLHPVTVGLIVRAMMDDAGVKLRPGDGVSPHALRHTAATDMLRAGAHVRDVQAALGHARLSTTEIYLPLVVTSLEKAMEGRHYADRAQPRLPL